MFDWKMLKASSLVATRSLCMNLVLLGIQAGSLAGDAKQLELVFRHGQRAHHNLRMVFLDNTSASLALTAMVSGDNAPLVQEVIAVGTRTKVHQPPSEQQQQVLR